MCLLRRDLAARLRKQLGHGAVFSIANSLQLQLSNWAPNKESHLPRLDAGGDDGFI